LSKEKCFFGGEEREEGKKDMVKVKERNLADPLFLMLN
jgi:hypothetical protein